MDHDRSTEAGTFRPLNLAEIVDELQLENGELAGALVDLRRLPSYALRQRVEMITARRQTETTGAVSEPPRRPGPASWPRLALRVGAVAVVLVIAALLLIITVPPVRAAFERIMQQRFGLVLVLPEQIATKAMVPEGSPEMTAEVEIIHPSLTVADVQTRVPFAIPVPKILPEGFEYWAVYLGTGPYAESMDADGNRIASKPSTQVVLVFKPDGEHQAHYHPDATLTLLIFDQTGMEGGYAVPAGSEQEVVVNGRPAVLVQGAWVKPNEEVAPSASEIAWDETYDAAMLSWEANGFTYTLSGSELALLPEEYIAIAESIR